MKVRFKPGREKSDVLVDVFDGKRSTAQTDGAHRVNLKPYAWCWLRVGDGDNVLDRDGLDLMRP